MKNWYIIEDKTHLGPYTARNLISLYEQGKIFDDTEIWKEGMEAPTTYKKEFIDSLNDLMGEEKKKPVDEVVPPKKHIAIDSNKVLVFEKSKNNQNTENETIQEFRPESLKEKKQKTQKKLAEPFVGSSFNKYFLLFVGAILTGLILLSGIDYYRYKKVLSKPKDLEASNYERLLAAQKTTTHLTFELALNKDHSALYMATNWNNIGKFSAKFKSLKGKILSHEDIQFEAKGNLENYFVKFDNIRFKKGLKIIDGFYEVELSSISEVKRSPLLWFIKKPNKKIRYHSTFFISSVAKDEVLNIINANENKEREQIKSYFHELEQTLLTLRGLYIETNAKFGSLLGASVKEFPLAFKNFEFYYTSNPGQMFTQFLLTNDNNLKTFNALKHIKAVDLVSIVNEINKNMQSYAKMMAQYMGQTKSSKVTQFPMIKNDFMIEASTLLGECELQLKRVQDEKNRL
jgi:hypothetical protein